MHIEGCDHEKRMFSLTINGEQLRDSQKAGYSASGTLRWRNDSWDVDVTFETIDREWVVGTFKSTPKGGPVGAFHVCSRPYPPRVKGGMRDVVLEAPR
jgi:hypothetical protein